MVEVVSFLGGLFKGISVCLFVFLWPFREIMYYKKLINSMFSVCTTEEDLQTAFGYLVDEEEDSEDESPNVGSKAKLYSSIEPKNSSQMKEETFSSLASKTDANPQPNNVSKDVRTD